MKKRTIAKKKESQIWYPNRDKRRLELQKKYEAKKNKDLDPIRWKITGTVRRKSVRSKR